MNRPHFERARLLIAQSRHEMAEQELRHVLFDEPNNPVAHSLLAVCLVVRNAYQEATSEAEQAIHLAPDLAYVHYVLAFVMRARNRLPEGEAAIRAAIALDPNDADHFALQASIFLQQKKWRPALEAAEQGMAIDPESVQCANLRATALTQLGRRESATETLELALRKDPGNAHTHANLGWVKLEQGRHAEALEHFREALRLDPESDWARSGIVEALKARHVVYRLMLGYFFWMSKLSGRTQWIVILGAYFGYQFLRAAAQNAPHLAAWIQPVLWLYIVFVWLTWTATPLFNLMLRLNRYGRLALSREQVVASNWVGLCLLGAVILLVAGLLFQIEVLLLAALMGAVFVLPVSAVHKLHDGWPRRVMNGCVLGLLACAVIGTTGLLAIPSVGELAEFIGTTATVLFFVGVFASQFLALGLASWTPRH